MIKLTEEQIMWLADAQAHLEKKISSSVPSGDFKYQFMETEHLLHGLSEYMGQLANLRKIQFDNDEW